MTQCILQKQLEFLKTKKWDILQWSSESLDLNPTEYTFQLLNPKQSRKTHTQAQLGNLQGANMGIKWKRIFFIVVIQVQQNLGCNLSYTHKKRKKNSKIILVCIFCLIRKIKKRGNRALTERILIQKSSSCLKLY